MDLSDKQLKEEIEDLHSKKDSNEFTPEDFQRLMDLEDENDERLENSRK